MIDLQQEVARIGAVAVHEVFPWCPGGVDFWRLPATTAIAGGWFVHAHHRAACRADQSLYLYGFVPMHEREEGLTMRDAAPVHTSGKVAAGFVFAPGLVGLERAPLSAAYDLAGGSMDFGTHTKDIERFLCELRRLCRVFYQSVYVGELVCSFRDVADKEALSRLVVTSYHRLRAQMAPLAVPQIDDLINDVSKRRLIFLNWMPARVWMPLDSAPTENGLVFREMVQAQAKYISLYPENPTIESIRKWMEGQPQYAWHRAAMRRASEYCRGLRSRP